MRIYIYICIRKQTNKMIMKTVDNFFNKLASEIDKTYFPTVVYYRDHKECTKCHYSIELFNNGCLTYNNLIKDLVKYTKDTKEKIETIVNQFIIN